MRDGEVVGEHLVGEINRSKIVELMAGRLLVEEINHLGKKEKNQYSPSRI